MMLQFISVASFFLDGFAFAAEALVGRAIGATHRAGLVLAAKLTAVGRRCRSVDFDRAADVRSVDHRPPYGGCGARAAAHAYLLWGAAAALVGVWAFQLDGIFIGATQTADMRNAMGFSRGAVSAQALRQPWLMAAF